jgi:hypothetical protein
LNPIATIHRTYNNGNERRGGGGTTYLQLDVSSAQKGVVYYAAIESMDGGVKLFTYAGADGK